MDTAPGNPNMTLTPFDTSQLSGGVVFGTPPTGDNESYVITSTPAVTVTSTEAQGQTLAHNVTIGVLLGAMIATTLFGNILVVTAVASFRRLRSITNYFVVSLAVADITVATLVMPYALVYQLFTEWRFGWVFCYFWISCDVTCCTASILHLCVIALDRYLAITQPFSYHSKMSRKRALLMIAGVWICSSAISFVPIYLGWFIDSSMAEQLYRDSPNCGLYVNKIYAVISSSTSFYIPLLVMIFAYVKIFRIARKQAAEIRRLECSISPDNPLHVTNGSQGDVNLDRVRKRSKRVQRDTKAIKTLGTLVGLFCVSWLPFFLMYLIMPFCEGCTLHPSIESAITWLGYMNSCINPCVYAFLNRDFRVAFKRILSCGGRCTGYRRNTRNWYQSSCCDAHPGEKCNCDAPHHHTNHHQRRASSSSSGARTPSILSRDRLKLEVRNTNSTVTSGRQNGYNKPSRTPEKRFIIDNTSPLTEDLEFREQIMKGACHV